MANAETKWVSTFCRHVLNEWWRKNLYISAMQTGQVPELEFNGFFMSQSISIARFLAKEFNLSGKDHKAQFQSDMIVDCCVDFMEEIYRIIFEKDQTRKTELEKALIDTVGPNFFRLMSKMLDHNGGECFAGDGISYADIFASIVVDNVELSDREKLIKIIPQSMKDLKATVTANPGIKKHLESRPKTPM